MNGGRQSKRKRFVFLLSGGILLAAALIIAVTSGRAKQYREAVKAENAGETAAAYGIYTELGDYKDSPERKRALEASEPALRFSSSAEGEIICFGCFEQNGIAEDGTEELEWIVLDQRDGRVLLLSRYVIACLPYNREDVDMTWEDCSLRGWLNEDFIGAAFQEADQALLLEVRNRNNGSPVFETEGGSDTSDRVFLLSAEEASAYFHEDDTRMLNGRAEPTYAAVLQGVSTTIEEETELLYAPWWLRGPGVYQDSAAFVETDGTVYENGAILDNENFCGVRPALWVRIMS
ncbi:MAG: DUF6273 domain-containing protein [Oscillospiraceae bacterium]|nr:DUF6273 domain-containing protein [Oscillospiraceae bacterium]